MWEHILFNCTAATVLAPFAYASRWLARPAVTHLMWLFVLARLVAPPIYSISLLVPSPPATTIAGETIGDDEIALELTPAMADVQTAAIELPAAPAAVDAVLDTPPNYWAWALVIGALGTTTYAARRSLELFRFCSALARSRPAEPATTDLVDRLARRLRMAAPKVVTMTGRFSPCVVATWHGTLLVLPESWLAGLDPLQRAAVLVHELAHIKRRDHWVRWFEVGVGGLFWWHPIVWLARQQLREAEELCCDSWVVATLPAARRAYADALIDTLDFLATSVPALPPLACGFGQVRELRRRLVMILKTRPAVGLGRAGSAVALAFGLFLPLSVNRSEAQDAPPAPPPPPPPPASRAERPQPPAPPAPARDRAGSEYRGGGARNEEMVELRRAYQEAQRRMEEAQANVERLRARMERYARDFEETRRDGNDTPRPRGEGRSGPDGPSRGGADAPRPSERRTEGQRPEPRSAGGPGGGGGGGQGGGRGDGPGRAEGPGRPAEPGRGDWIGRGEGAGRFEGRGQGPTPSSRAETPRPRAEGRGDAERRIQDLEMQLNDLRRELDKLRSDRKPPVQA